MWIALVWMAHIGMDRAVGYGLNYPTGFKHTHLTHEDSRSDPIVERIENQVDPVPSERHRGVDSVDVSQYRLSGTYQVL